MAMTDADDAQRSAHMSDYTLRSYDKCHRKLTTYLRVLRDQHCIEGLLVLPLLIRQNHSLLQLKPLLQLAL